MRDIGLDAAQHIDDAVATVTWLPPADALHSDRIVLFQHDPERYFALYPRSATPIT